MSSDTSYTPDHEITACCLVVEDDINVKRLLQRFMTGAGFTVLTADDAAEALQVLRDHQEVDILITDMTLPGMTGAELISQAKALFPEIKAVLISGYPSANLALPAHYAFLEKPFTREELMNALRELY